MAGHEPKRAGSKPLVTDPIARAPITGHRLFPALVTLWFCALGGFGTLAVAPGLIDALIARSGLAALLPAASPPLEFGGRLLLALAMAGFGAIAGSIIAGALARPRVASNAPIAPAHSSNDAPEAGEMQASRRRNLVSNPVEHAASRDEAADLPGAAPQILDITAMDLGEPMAPPLEMADAPAAEPEPILRDPEALEPTPTNPGTPRQVFGMVNEGFGPAADGASLGQPAISDPVPSDFMPVEARAAAQAHRPSFGARQDQSGPASIPEDAAPLAGPREMPQALRPLAFGAEEEDAERGDALLRSLLPPRRTAEDGPGPRIADPKFDGEVGEPVVIFPGQVFPSQAFPGQAGRQAAAAAASSGTPTDPAETERALRTALASLQRISAAG